MNPRATLYLVSVPLGVFLLFEMAAGTASQKANANESNTEEMSDLVCLI